MSAFIFVSVLSSHTDLAAKRAVITVTGPALYDTGGSIIDLSSANAVMLAANGGFVRVDSVVKGSVNAAAADVTLPQYVRAAAGAPATGLIKCRDLAAAADAEVPNATDLSGTTWVLEVTGT